MGPKTLVVLSFCMVRIKATRNQKKKCIPCMVSYNWIYLFIYYAVSSMLHPCTSFPCILHENFAVQLLFSIFNVATLQLLRFPCNKMTFLIEAIHILIQPSVWLHPVPVFPITSFLLVQVPKDKCMGYNVRNEFMGYHIQHGLHVWMATWERIWGSPILQATSRSSMGHFPLLPLWCSGTEFHLSYHKPIWLPH